MKIEKYHIDYREGSYWVYSKRVFNEKEGKEYPCDATYFNTLAGALSEVRHQMIAKKIGKDKEDDLSTIMNQILNVDRYFAHCLSNLTSEQEKLVSNIPDKERCNTLESKKNLN
jgi:hypothetical protein